MTAAKAVPNMRERSRRETRRRLIEAGRKLFARGGFARTRATDISREAGVAVGMLYVHFTDKEDLLREILFRGFEEMHAVVRRIAETKFATVEESVRAHTEALEFVTAHQERRLLKDSQDGSLGVVDLAPVLGVTPAIVTRQVQGLEAQGLLRRRSDSRDRRRSQLHLTARGRRTFAQLHERAHELQTRVLGGLRDEEVAAACRVLRSLRTAVETQRHGSRD